MVYLISYDIAEVNRSDEKRVLDLLKEMGATRCLLSEWLFEGENDAELTIAKYVAGGMSAGDRLLVIRLYNKLAYTEMMNEAKCLEILNRA